MNVFTRLQQRQTCLAVVGLGYVGLPLAVAFAEKVNTLGFDINEEKIAAYRQGIDPTNEIGRERLEQTRLDFSSDPARLAEAAFIIVAVPTPINGDKTPDLTPLRHASKLIGRHLSPGSIVVFESTVYPGLTEEFCAPILESESGLVCGKDFKLGYSPERINPGDKVHRLENICKIVAGMDEETRDCIAAVYELIIQAGVYKAASIKVAEAAKLAENAQRDINIAFMNELAVVFQHMGITTKDVMAAMNTKWNALNFYPGLVGGHCIGVDPHYFIYRAELLGCHSQLIAAGRQVNESMSKFISDSLINLLIQTEQNIRHARIYVMGISFKEDCPDMRNSKAADICKHLAAFGIPVSVVDPVVDPADFKREFAMELTPLSEVTDADCLLFAVPHQQFKQLQAAELARMCRTPSGPNRPVVMDIRTMFDRQALEDRDILYWSL
ncbi:MAG: nucleotide sugar dehydrogenase [Sporomusaceae bacterium]|nr:nucleotide sugar dehydrogenase [Sporomusaceae bacterium]